jgi:hypothetical protein
MANIEDLTVSWEGHTKGEVEDFIKRYLGMVNAFSKEKASCVGFKDMTAYLFASAEDKQEWENTGVENWIDSTPLVIVGTERKIQITNVSGNNNPYFTTASDSAEITVSFRSLEKDVLATEYTEIMEDALFTVSIDKGATGVWSVIASDVMVKGGDTYTIDVRNYLAVGANRIVIKAVGSSTGAVGQLNITANLTSMYLAPANFAWYTPYIEGQTYNLGGVNIGGNLTKTLHVKVTNETGYAVTYEQYLGSTQYINTSYYFDGMEFPTGGTGIYNVEMWVSSENVETEHLVYNIMCVAQKDAATAKLVAISAVPKTIINYADNTLFEYACYNGGAAVASPTVVVTGVVNNNPLDIVSETLQDIATGRANPYVLNVEIESEETNISLTANISLGASKQEAVYVVDNSASYPATMGAVFYMNAATRNNAQENREKIINISNGEEITATWERMAWEDGVDGWTVDDKGRKCLRIAAGSRCVIDYQPMLAEGVAKTIEFTYKLSNVADYDEPIISISDDASSPTFKGLVIRPTNILLHSRDLTTSNLTQGIDVKDEEYVNMQATVIRNYKINFGNLAKIFVNGAGARSFAFEATDNWVNVGKIILGNDTSDLYVYNIRVYEQGFDKEDAERNYIASLPLSSEKKAMYALINGVRDDVGRVDFDKVNSKYNTMLIRMRGGADLPHYGLSKEYNAYCDVTFSFLDLPQEYKVKAWKFILENCRIEGQGTTSMNYWLWNLRYRIDKSNNIVIIYPNGTEQTI